MVRLIVIVAIGASVTNVGASGSMFQVPELEPVRVIGRTTPLYHIRDVAVQDSLIVVLTDPAPAIHIFINAAVLEWGREGAGPGEMRNPVQVSLTTDSVYVLDALPGATRLTRYSLDGASHAVQMLDEVSVATHFEMPAGRDLFVLASAFGSRRVQVLRVGPRPDTILSWLKAPTVKLSASEGPTRSFSVYLPFENAPQWTVSGGSVLFWDGREAAIALYDADGERKGEWIVAFPEIEVNPAHRGAWFDRSFPAEFLGRKDDPLAMIREAAREQIVFPERFPPVLDMMPDPGGGVWVKRTPAARGEIWTYVKGSRSSTVRFPPGREVHAFGSVFVVATTRDPATDVELVEVYSRSSVDTQSGRSRE